MKVVLLLNIAFWISFGLPARAQESTGTDYRITGAVVDSISDKPLDYITINLKNTANKVLKTTLTKTNGTFSFENLSPGKFIISVVAVGYSTKNLAVNISNLKNVDLGSIRIASADKQLKEVVVTADRPLIKQEVDRISYDVQADPESKIQTALDMLRKVPLISVDAEDNIKLKGNSSYKILINGRASSMMARDPKEILKNLPANTISKIEVITNPPAKYDAEGLAGIINIITSKKIDNGYNASLSSRYNNIQGLGVNGNANLKTGKIGLSANGGRSWRDRPESTILNTRTGINPFSILLQPGENNESGNYTYGGGEFSYEIDSLNLVTASVGANSWSSNQSTSQFSFFTTEQTEESFHLKNLGNFDWDGLDLGVNYQLGFKRNKEQLLTGSYKYNYSKDSRFSQIFTTERVNYHVDDYEQENKSGTKEQTFQLDYIHPFKKIDVEGGFKAILRDNFSDFIYRTFNPDNGQFIKDPRSNNFDYRQNVFSVYNSYNLKLKDWGIKAGVRLERTVVDANFAATDSELEKQYNNFIPSVSVQKKFKNMNSISLGYTQRIQRPSIWELNPFAERSNPKYIFYGNPELKAVLNHSFDLSFSTFKKGSINAALNYSFANNNIESVLFLHGDTTEITFKNIGKNKRLGLNTGFNFSLTKKLSINANGDISYVWLQGFVNNLLYKNSGLQGNAYAYASYSFENNWKASINAGYYSGWLTLQGVSSPYIYSSLNISKEFLKKKATISGGVANPFQKYRTWKNILSSPDFIENNRSQDYYRSFNVSLNYRFGKLKQDIRKNKRGITNDDIKSAGKQ